MVRCFPEWSSGLSRHAQQGTGVPSTINCAPGSSPSAVGTFSARTPAIRGVRADRVLETVGRRNPEQFGEELLFEIVSQAGQNEPDALMGAESA